jgi:hypothetical protein
MTELHTQINSTEATAPLSPTPGKGYNWNQFYGIPAVTTTVESSVINNPDNANGTSSVSEQPATYTDPNGLFVTNNSKPFWHPDLTNMSPGSFQSTPYTGPPQPITN